MMKLKPLFAIIALLSLVLVLSACSESKVDKATEDKNEITSSLIELNDTTYSYEIKNNTDKAITLKFTSGQRFDFSLSADGEVVHQLSTVSMYTQAEGEETVEAGKSLKYEFSLPIEDLEAGKYELKAWLTPAEGPKYEAETEYSFEK